MKDINKEQALREMISNMETMEHDISSILSKLSAVKSTSLYSGFYTFKLSIKKLINILEEELKKPEVIT